MFDKIGYKLKIMIIFSAMSGILGFLLFYCTLLIIYKIKSEYFYIYKDYGYRFGNISNNYSKIADYNKMNKIRKIRPPDLKSDDENKIFDENKKEKIIINKSNLSWDINNNNNVIYNNVRKIEMKNLEKKNEWKEKALNFFCQYIYDNLSFI